MSLYKYESPAMQRKEYAVDDILDLLEPLRNATIVASDLPIQLYDAGTTDEKMPRYIIVNQRTNELTVLPGHDKEKAFELASLMCYAEGSKFGRFSGID